MDAKPTYHLPPNFSTPPPSEGGPFYLGTVLRDFEQKEQMRPLNRGEEQRIVIAEKYSDHKRGFAATRKKLKSGELGLWAKFLGLEGVGGEASISAGRSDTDTVETEYFYPDSTYISDCLNLSDVEDYLKGVRYRKPVYLVTGIKVGMGATVRMERGTEINGKLEGGVNISKVAGMQLGPKVQGKLEDQPTCVFTKSSNIVVGLQCLKVYHGKSDRFSALFGNGKAKTKSEYVTSGAAFHGESSKVLEVRNTDFIVGDPSDDRPGLIGCTDGEDIWMVPNEPDTEIS
ncbi:major facilitator superfamily MFS-1 [Fusarium austroafricanum]|uniref:Major facilitator superfamily MFS-1 n=1 Tax=Fusarium austroafricanum TaxID=2364996 RepID=A0A8H4NPH8_9HYPO|nr:major facilitator superfamily MFS-1 [Fusarium austroafricanum]